MIWDFNEKRKSVPEHITAPRRHCLFTCFIILRNIRFVNPFFAIFSKKYFKNFKFRLITRFFRKEYLFLKKAIDKFVLR